jgi:CBS domain-containing protein
MKIREILQAKGTDVVTIAPDAPVPEAMRVLVQHNIGALVVMDGDTIAGIISERDMLRTGAADLNRLATAQVHELMTKVVFTAGIDADIRDVMDTMTERRIRHLPIVHDGKLHGMISVGDVINKLRERSETEIQQLHAYISGTPL